jgi:iron-sulfur cluster assembly accessory protein
MDPKRVYVRVGIKVDGEGYHYILELDERDREAGDIDVRTGGLLVRVHKSAMPLLRGTTIDFKDGDGARGFVFHNPNAKESAK